MTEPKKKKNPKSRSDEEVILDIKTLIVETDEQFRGSEDFYRAITIRVIDYLLKTRPKLFPEDWRK